MPNTLNKLENNVIVNAVLNLKSKIREIPDWPKKGVSFKDITTLLKDREAFLYAIDKLAEPYLPRTTSKKAGKGSIIQGKDVRGLETMPDIIVGIAARGFLLSSGVAYKLKKGLAIIRKEGKLPYKTIKQKYTLEYAANVFEMHEDAISAGQKVAIIDDVLATGGTMQATVNLIERLGGKVIGISFLIELDFLHGREKLKNYNINSLIHYES